MSNSPSDLILAIERRELSEVRALLEAGANPYARDESGRTALKSWQEESQKGNPDALEMALLLLALAPVGRHEIEVLRQVAERQVEHVAHALGVAEQAVSMGIDPSAAYLPPVTLPAAQATWSVVRSALEQVTREVPAFDPARYALGFATGGAAARSLMVHEGGGAASIRAGKPENVDLMQLSKMLGHLRALGKFTVLPLGSVASGYKAAKNADAGQFYSGGKLVAATGHFASGGLDAVLPAAPNLAQRIEEQREDLGRAALPAGPARGPRAD